jgi:probable rRNA maturation factor
MKLIPVLLNNETVFESPSIEQFDLWVETAIEAHGEFFQVSIEIVNEQLSQELNKTYRGQDKPTNVLSFALDIPEDLEEDLIGDLAICAPLVEAEANAQGKAILHHWAHLTIHGVLHLLGYDHNEEAQAEKMERLEVKLLKRLNIPNPYED